MLNILLALNMFSSIFTKIPSKDIEKNKIEIQKAIDLVSNITDNGNYSLTIKEICAVESNIGLISKWKPSAHNAMGITQIDYICLKETKNTKKYPELIPIFNELKKRYNIDFKKDIKIEHCNYIFYSVLTTKLYLIIKKHPVKHTIEERAFLWKKYYNTYKGKGTISHYIQTVNRLL